MTADNERQCVNCGGIQVMTAEGGWVWWALPYTDRAQRIFESRIFRKPEFSYAT